MAFIGVSKRRPSYMLPILAVTILNEVVGLIYLGFAIAAICSGDSPLAQAIINLNLNMPKT
ncbi:hypothetical protein PENTCL1PPCAC_143 [Pristionchus entomophagus]|uniref:Uncharacterized protein n=1 Tax=Pristionchus entomophagus TaxID=358040 RepID=A0AAV5SBI3_9BILA|nr:hypothetical protein PENTCL1PPCAC_143 [Pristionchus entomophagus]